MAATLPDGVTVERVVRGTTDRASFSMRMYHPVPDLSPEREMALEALSGVLSVRLRDALREDLGGTYVPGVYGWLAERPSPEWVQAIQFQCFAIGDDVAVVPYLDLESFAQQMGYGCLHDANEVAQLDPLGSIVWS